MNADEEQDLGPWTVRGTYFEACNCQAICPCRKVGERAGGRSTYGHCDFALSWRILDGRAGELDLSGLDVVMAGSYDDDPSRPSRRGHELWGVALYIDQRATVAQYDALSRIFLGRAGGSTFTQFAQLINEVYGVRRATIHLDHRSTGQPSIDVPDHVSVRASHRVHEPEPISCGIPGHDHPGQEWVTDLLHVRDDPLAWTVVGRCGFGTDFHYSSAA
jgi:hypothetical protein